ncbi:chemotaxis regulatin CheY-phosphate phosphatase CheZ [Azospirillum brasilense]|nr:protein phosphatase CheZ [Azospirillum brasilense]TVZ61328.1 chemotaxis regulatin CheY-phosphate phosphatase CheZ [Azospirillum brasilense]TWB80595.1 chemotaxis regulatin CheY-phosphate phosphatase CheZ [Azospirillum brasilense]
MDQLPQLSEEEFDQIEEAIARTTKGRAFLRRFHRRAHGAAAEEVRKMLLEFRSSWHQQSEVVEASKHVEVLRRELMEMAASIEQARREVAALRPPDAGGDKITSATNELDAIVISTERASFEILNAAERLMDLSGKLKADGADPGLCSEIEGEVTNIFTACSFQDLTGQRTSKVVNALRYIEQRVNAMINIWGVEKLAGLQIAPENTDTRPDSHLLNGPQLDGLGVSQADVDSMFDSPAMAAPPPAPEPPPAPPPSPAPAVAGQTGAKASQADIDSLFDSPAPAPAAPAKASQADIDSLFDSPAPAPAAPAKASQADIDSLFDSPAPAPAAAPPAPAPAPAPAAKKPVPKPASAAKPAPKPAPAAKPAAAPPPAADEPPAPLDQAAIDALFG